MKIQPAIRQSESGSTLLVALIITAIMGLTLASYLVMTQSQNVSVVRSQTWNAAMALAESGIEDGLALVNKNNNNFDQLPFWVNTASSDGYSVLPNGQYYVKRYVSTNAWGTNFYEVFINNANTNSPIITSIGYVAWKYSYASARAQTMFAIANANIPAAIQTANRKVNVQTKVDPLFAVAMAALLKIDMKGNNVSTDSFDSANPLYSTNGLYPAGITSMIRSNGDIATDASIINSINVGNANIKGKAKTGPGGTVSVGPNGYVTGGIADDFNVQFPNVQVPSGTYFAVGGSITVDGKAYAASITSSGNYWLGSSTFTKTLYIGSNVTANIYVTADVQLTASTDEIRIANGAHVKMYMKSASFSIKGQGIVNNNGNADSFYYYGLPANTSIDFGGNGGFTGAIYAPQASFSLGGGGNNVNDFIGASVTKDVTMNGHFNFHYDENLRRIGPGRGYVPTDWNEGG